MDLTPREKEVLKSILLTELADADELVKMNDNERDKNELTDFYAVVRSIMNKLD